MSLLSRIFGKAEPARTRRFDGTASGRRGWGMGTFGRINSETAAAGPDLRSLASYLAMNNPWISQAVGKWTGALAKGNTRLGTVAKAAGPCVATVAVRLVSI